MMMFVQDLQLYTAVSSINVLVVSCNILSAGLHVSDELLWPQWRTQISSLSGARLITNIYNTSFRGMIQELCLNIDRLRNIHLGICTPLFGGAFSKAQLPKGTRYLELS